MPWEDVAFAMWALMQIPVLTILVVGTCALIVGVLLAKG